MVLDADTLALIQPAFISWSDTTAGGPLSPINLTAFVTAAAIVFIARQAWSTRPRVPDARQLSSTQPPDALHPAYAGALASGAVTDSQVEATVVGLAQRGALAIRPDENDPEKVQIVIRNHALAETSFEEELLSILGRRAREGVLSYPDLMRIRSSWGPVRAAIRKDLIDRGWFAANASQRRLPFVATGIIGLLVALTAVVVAIVAASGWPVLGAFAVGIAAVGVLGMGSIFPDTTHEGEEAAVAWRGFRVGLARARDDGHGAIDLDQAFPYIIALNMSAQYNRYFRRASQSGYVPAWLGTPERVASWPAGWHDYWIALHTAIAPTDAANTKSPAGSFVQRTLTGGRS